jgi:opacity protein-like surface antigen
MRNFALLSASALVLALGVASASAQPTTDQLLAAGQAGRSSAQAYEGRGAVVESQAPVIIDQFRHAGR